MIRIASYNVENLFARPNAFDSSDWSVGKPILKAFEKANDLFQKSAYTEADKKKMIECFLTLDLYRKNDVGAIRQVRTPTPKWAWLRSNRGKFDKQPKDKTKDVEIIATGRSDWIGWVELATEPTNVVGTQLTARVIQDVDADIIGVVEAEDRPSLVRFNEELLGDLYSQVMLVDGNDKRGIDVGIMTKKGCKIESIRSNVDATDSVGTIFSRDCPQYEISVPSGETIHILINHFKSQSGGGGPKRKRQAKRVRKIVDDLVAAGQHVVVLGDLNEGPKSNTGKHENIGKLFEPSSPLNDCFSLPNFDKGPREGTYDSCALSNRLDYILISDSLKPAFKAGGVFRKGLWGSRKTKPDAWVIYSEMTKSVQQASDHSAVWVDLNL